MFFPSVDHNCAGVSPDVDDIVEITVGVVKGVAELLTTFCCEAVPHASLLIADLLHFVLLILKVYSDYDTWRWWRNLVVHCFCLVGLCVKEEFIVVAGIVVDEIDSFHWIIIVLLDFRDYCHENLAIWEVGLLVVVFFLQRNTLLEREFHVF